MFGGMPSSLAATRLSYENVKLFTTSSVVCLYTTVQMCPKFVFIIKKKLT